MRYGSGNYTEWEEDRQASKNDDSLGLDGWYGNQTIAYEAERLAEKRGDHGANTGKGGDYWDMAKQGLLQAGRRGEDIHSGRFAQENEDEMAYLRSQLEGSSKKEEATPEPDPAPVYNEVEYPSRSTAKERVELYDSGKTMASIFGTGGTKELDEANVTNAMQEQAAEPGLNLQENPFDTQRKKSNIANMVTGQQAGLG